MRIFIFFVLAMALLSCNIKFPEDIIFYDSSNPFLEGYDVSKLRNSDTIKVASANVERNPDVGKLRFIVITDVHIGRDRDSSSVKYFHDNFFSYLEKNKPPFIICLGDLTDDGEYSEATKSFIDHSAALTENNWFIYCIGNHERHIFDYDKWKIDADESGYDSGFDLKHFSGTMGNYHYGDLLSIYKLDSSMRILGQEQLAYLEEALKKDNAKYKIVLSHENVTTGGALDQSLFMLGIGDIQERNRLYRILSENKVGLLLSGHHHKGNIEYHMNKYLGELNLAAYHQKKTVMDLESDGYFYECILDADTGEMTINGYLAEYTHDETRTPDRIYKFTLPKSN